MLEAHPAVSQAVVVGYPDERLGQRVAACVIAAQPFDLDACRSWFARQGMARFKTPERVAQVDAFPLLSLGKPDRDAVRRNSFGRNSMGCNLMESNRVSRANRHDDGGATWQR